MDDMGEVEAHWLMLSTLQHHAYCARQAWLIADGVWSDNRVTAIGSMQHERVHTSGSDHRSGLVVHHAVRLAHRGLRICGVADSVEVTSDGSMAPVEHKHGRGAGDLTPSVIQVVAQALCLEDMTARPVPQAVLYITKEKRRIDIDVRAQEARTRTEVEAVRMTLARAAPPPFASIRLCRSCSVSVACQPPGLGSSS